jgi:hydrogenase maturation protease
LNTKLSDAIANAVLYEGYMLYPYRPSSVKNRQRFNFGVLYPQVYSDAQTGSDACGMQTECLIEGGSVTALEVRARFLRLVDRSVFKVSDSALGQSGHASESVTQLEFDGKVFTPWQEAIECEITLPLCNLNLLAAIPLEWNFAFPATEEVEVLQAADGQRAGLIVRKQKPVRGTVEVNAAIAGDDVYKIRVRLKNLTPPAAIAPEEISREQALMDSLVSAHALLGVVDGRFVSLLEPPENLKDLASTCQNVGVFPVLVGGEGERDTMLASPIILYDYPQIAPESPGDLFDGTEIDEILALRILTMTEDEKREMRNTDDRARKMLERTENLPTEHLAKLHGTLRELRPVQSLHEETP